MREIEGTFVFVDLAGYTAATWVHGDDLAAHLAIRLADMALSSCDDEDEVVKSIGDAVLCRAPDATRGLQFLARLWQVADLEANFPLLRAAAHHGAAVEHGGDYFGTTVNIAARLAALAGPDEILSSSTVADAAARLDWTTASLGPKPLRNLATPIEVFRLWCVEREQLPVDPICQMRVDVRTAHVAESAGEVFYFCSPECVDAFTSRVALARAERIRPEA